MVSFASGDAQERQLAPGAIGPPTATGDVALLIDWENLKYSLLNEFGASVNTSSLMDTAGEFGRVVVARAYGDWTQPNLTADVYNVYRAGIEPVFVQGRIKNSADVRLAVDAVDICMRMAHITTFVIVTGDADLIHPINYIRLAGRRSVVIGVGPTMAGRLIASVDRVIRYEQDIEPVRRRWGDDIDDDTRRAAKSVLFERVIGILQEQADGGEMAFNQLGTILKERYRFNAIQQFGVSFKLLMLEARDAGLIHLRTEGLMDFASLPGAQPEPDLEAETLASAEGAASAPAVPAPRAEPPRQPFVEVPFEALNASERAALIACLADLDTQRRELPYRYIVNTLVRDSVLPSLTPLHIERLVNELADLDILRREIGTGTNQANGDLYEFTKFVLDEEHPVVAPILHARAAELRESFAGLQEAIRETRERHGYAFMTEVQRLFEQQQGQTLRSRGFDRPQHFFREAERDGLIRIVEVDGAHVLLLPDDPEPDPAQLATRRSVVAQIDDHDFQIALRVLAAAEDEVFARTAREGVNVGSLVYLLRNHIRTRMNEELSIDALNYFLKEELVSRGILRHHPTPATHPVTGIRSIVNIYLLDREHPEVAKALEKAAPRLDSRVYLKPAVL